MSARLLRIETRRTVTLWLLPVMIALAWIAFRQRYTGAVGVA
jgi:hypothetical protein